MGENGTLRKTANGGASWQAVNARTSASLQAVRFTSSTNGYVVGNNGTALRTQDGGTTWTQMQVNTSVALRDVYFKTPMVGYIVGDVGTILHTRNGGDSWEEQASNTFESLYAITSVPQTSRIWTVGSSGLVLTNDGLITSNKAGLASAYEVYPNPFTKSIQIKSLNGVRDASVELLDATGKVVLRLSGNELQGSSYVLNTNCIQKGMYFVRINSAKASLIKKVIKAD